MTHDQVKKWWAALDLTPRRHTPGPDSSQGGEGCLQERNEAQDRLNSLASVRPLVHPLRQDHFHQGEPMKALLGRVVMRVRDVVSGRQDLKQYGDPEAHRHGPHNRDANLAHHYIPTPAPAPGNFPSSL
ncbi:hypothetical protein ACFVY4_33430 [Streptomyces sp. NPDC058299]|uniref:hypothetical protein n=1 Tax=Streptomyces sp. NPDC058299 TaxID=3346435 RepID=UPI0036E1BD02